MKAEESMKKTTPTTVSSLPSLPRVAEQPLPVSAPMSSGAATPEVKKVKSQVDRSRCAECKKKVGLTAVECRCGHVYCGAHRLAEKHACSFDFKAFGRSNIEKMNEKVVAQSLGEKL